MLNLGWLWICCVNSFFLDTSAERKVVLTGGPLVHLRLSNNCVTPSNELVYSILWRPTRGIKGMGSTPHENLFLKLTGQRPCSTLLESTYFCVNAWYLIFVTSHFGKWHLYWGKLQFYIQEHFKGHWGMIAKDREANASIRPAYNILK